MNSRRETAAVHRPGRDPQRVLPTAPPSQREAEISHRKKSRTEVHDTMVRVWAAMQQNVGMECVVEDRGWDWGAGGRKHHRPDMAVLLKT